MFDFWKVALSLKLPDCSLEIPWRQWTDSLKSEISQVSPSELDIKGTTLEQCQCYNGEILEDVRTLLAVFYYCRNRNTTVWQWDHRSVIRQRNELQSCPTVTANFTSHLGEMKIFLSAGVDIKLSVAVVPVFLPAIHSLFWLVSANSRGGLLLILSVTWSSDHRPTRSILQSFIPPHHTTASQHENNY